MENNIAERTIVLRLDLVKRLEQALLAYPGLNLNSVINEALELWLRGPQEATRNVNPFIVAESKGFGPVLKKENF
jgi:hypothetical protein